MKELDCRGTKVKCVVWDLDNTVWDGVLLEDGNVNLFNEVASIIKTLDSRGILQSIASKNDYDLALAKLEEFGLREYFIYPQINWNSKSFSIKEIAKAINIGVDTLAFIDDQQFELEEVKFAVPEVFCIDASNLGNLLDIPEMNPVFITEDSKNRRLMYVSDIERNKLEDEFEGPKEEFLASLNMSFTIMHVQEGDLQRAEELTVRTHQLNTTGYTYSYEELDSFRKSNKHKLLIASLEDKFGTYGKIGLALVECNDDEWILKMLLMSCRVMSRGVGTIMINYVAEQAKKAGVRMLAEFIPNDRNRMMYITYKFAGFQEIQEKNGLCILEKDTNEIPPYPDYIRVVKEDIA
ncbi:HAD-IIIC family phosphatase [Ruminiclostridium cellulolyticum]|uniref:FkbH like protein n=1 Tax=Ruminiclostridium cellulolyticum (strain ATCC 35319 / DSM 5812 / JCM 6584 / H10) TaxID=394503 RepID=B8I991_RUMCH|nr:HAD-IIIC family phosphatase [Ruminiclostridium cellulolyticum]ACL75351.1 FkbH like protein [Ruminiclostridium cellulolyticum H10]